MIKRLILSISLVLVMCFTFTLNTNSIEVKAENNEVSLSIYKNNLSYSSEIYFLYSLQYENIDIEKNSIELLFWDSVQEKYLKGTESYSKKSVALEEIDEKMCLVYYSEGIDAKNIVDELYTRAYVKIDEVEYYSDVDVTSVVEYVYRMKKTGELSDTLNNLFDALLDYGAAAQLKFEYKTDTLANELIKEVKVVNGLVNERESDAFYQDYNVTITALDKTSEDLLFKYWTDSEGNIVSYESEYSFEVLENETYTANYVLESKVSEGLVLSEELFYDEGLDLIDLPSAVLVEKGDEAYILDIEWDTSTFIKNSIGEQTLYASLVDKSAYEEFGINEGDIKAVLTVLPYTMILASDNESYIITKYYGNETDVIIPTTAKSLSVTGIDGYGFSFCASIETVVIPETITSIGSATFRYCSSLRSVEIKSDLQSLSSSTFNDCINLQNVILPDTITVISENAFDGCSSLEEIDLPSNLITLGSYAFRGCSSLLNITIPNGVTQIPDYLFYNCSNLINVELGDNVINIGWYSFYNCESLEAIVLPSSLRSISYEAFYGCSTLQSVTMGNNIASIGSGTFEKNSSLSDVYFNGTIEDWCSMEFYSYLSNPIAPLSATLHLLGEDGEYFVPERIVIPETIVQINPYAFYGFNDIKYLTIDPSVNKIKSSAFCNCNNLKEIYYNGTLEEWNSIAFSNDTANPLINNGAKLITKESIDDEEVNQTVFNIKYNLEGGESSLELPSTYKMTDDTYTLPTKEEMYKEDYEFYGWYSNKDMLGGAITEISSGSIGDIELFAVWVSSEAVLVELSDADREIIQNYKPNKFVIADLGASKYEINGYEYLFGVDIFNNINDALSKSSEYDVIYVFAGEYALFADIRKSVTILGPNADKGSQEERNEEALVTIFYDQVDTFAANVRFNGLSLNGNNEPTNTGIYFQCRVGTEEFTLESCIINHGNTFIKVVSGSDMTINVLNSRISQIGQFLVWSLAGTTSNVNIKGNYYSGNTCGTLGSEITSQIRVLSGNTYVYNNFFLGDLAKATYGGYFSNRGNGEFLVKYNTFVDVTKYVCLTNLTSMVFDNNLYINSDTISTSSPVDGIINVTKDTTLATSSENLESIYKESEDYFCSKHDKEFKDFKAATCTESGHNSYQTCKNCDYSTYVEIPASHDVVEHEGKEATCTENGYKAYVTCTRCDYSTYEEIEALGHDYVNHESKAATCTESGHNAYVACTRCDYSTYEEIEALGHDYVNHESKAATCTESGHNAYVACTRCDYSTYEEIEALGHKYSKEWTIDQEATETSIGTKSHHCMNEGCESRNNITEIPMLPYSDGLTYELNENADGYIVSGIGECTDSDIKISQTYNGLPVVEIKSYSFNGCTSLTSIEIPNSVESIGSSAFNGCTSLESITLPFVGQNADGTGETHFGYIFGGSASYGNYSSNVPSTLKEVIITGGTSIGASAFNGCTSLTSIEIPNSVTSIGSYAFKGCTSLESIEIPNSVTSIGSYAFYDCTSLTSIEIPNSVESIGYAAFNGCTSLTSIEIPNSVESIGSSAFDDCTSLESITLPFVGAELNGTSNTHFGYIFGSSSNVPSTLKEVIITGGTSIGEDAFYGCTSLESIEIPNSVTSIGSYAFEDCTSLTSIEIPNSVESIGASAFRGCTSLESITLPFVGAELNGTSNTHFGYIFGSSSSNSSVPTSLKEVIIRGGTSIGSSAFSGCTSLTSIEIPSSVTSIGPSAFSGCSSLVSIEIPSSVESIRSSAFEGCISLQSIIVEEGNSVYDSRENCNAIIETSRNEIIVGCKNTTIPTSVTSIGSYAFSGCTSLTSIEIPSSVESIGSSVFRGCTSLESITIPFVGAELNGTSNTHFGYIFGASSCSYNDDYVPTLLKEVIITGGIVIDASAFNGCTSLTSIEIPNSVTSIGSYAFKGCTSLESIEIPNSVTSIGSYAFYDCTSLTSIEIPNSVESIGSYAFEDCTSLTSIEIPNSVESIGYAAFRGCTSLTSIEIPSSVTSIGSSAFEGCISLQSIIVEEGNSVYDSRENCNAIIETSINEIIVGCKNTTIPTSVTSIGDYAFEDCTSLTSIEIPNSVESIGYDAFRGCTSLTSIEIPSSVTSIVSHAFEGCISLQSIIVEEGNSVYDSRENCNAIIETSINEIIVGCKNTTIPTSVTSIGSYAFYDCTSLTSIEIPNSVESIGYAAFKGCTSLTSIEIPNSVTSIGASAFRGCTSLESITLPFVGQNADGTGKTHFGYIFDESYNSNNSSIPTSLKEVIITGETRIDDSAFYKCASITTIEIASSITEIGTAAFYGCALLESIYFNGTLEEWENVEKNNLLDYYSGDLYIKDDNGEYQLYIN